MGGEEFGLDEGDEEEGEQWNPNTFSWTEWEK
jgi:hypothetical protein